MKLPRRNRWLIGLALLLLFLGSGGGGTAMSQPGGTAADTVPLRARSYAPGEVLVKFKEGVDPTVPGRLHARSRASLIRRIANQRVERLRIPDNLSVEDAVAFYAADPNVEYAEPNYVRRAEILPNDTDLGQLWGLHNTGQSVNGTAGTADADIDAPAAWDIATGATNPVIIAVIDSGVDWNHPDLMNNIWSNPGEVLNGSDDDGNGLIDDVRGWDFVDGDNDPTAFDDPGHGTHVAGTIAAEGDNGIGVTGVMWEAQIMPLRFLDTLGTGYVSDEVEAINYAIDHGAKIISASFGDYKFSTTERNAIAAAGAAGILFIAAAGNESNNNDGGSAHYPSSYPLDNVIAVAATTQFDALAGFSNYGATTVDLGAPGTNTFSTIPARQTIFSDDFEPDASAWTVTGTWGTTTAQSVSPTHSLTDSPLTTYAKNSDTSARVSSALDLTGEQGCRWDYRLRLSTFSGDNFSVERSSDATSWTLLPFATYAGSTGNAFFPFAEDLTAADGSPSVYVRFRLATNASGQSDGAYVDDVDLNCASTTYDGSEYTYLQGTSMATPHVSGVAGLVASIDPAFTPADIKSAILNMVDKKSSLTGRVLSGGRLNAYGAVRYATGADLEIVKTAPAPSAAIGSTVVMTTTVTNRGLQDATAVVVTDTLPSELTLVSAVPSIGSCGGTTTITCTLGDLAKGVVATIVVSVTADEGGVVSNTATVTGTTNDPLAANNSTTLVITIVSPSGGCSMVMSWSASAPLSPLKAVWEVAELGWPLALVMMRRWRKKEARSRPGARS